LNNLNVNYYIKRRFFLNLMLFRPLLSRVYCMELLGQLLIYILLLCSICVSCICVIFVYCF